MPPSGIANSTAPACTQAPRAVLGRIAQVEITRVEVPVCASVRTPTASDSSGVVADPAMVNVSGWSSLPSGRAPEGSVAPSKVPKPASHATSGRGSPFCPGAASAASQVRNASAVFSKSPSGKGGISSVRPRSFGKASASCFTLSPAESPTTSAASLRSAVTMAPMGDVSLKTSHSSGDPPLPSIRIVRRPLS